MSDRVLEVTLTWPEVMLGATVGIMRQVKNLKDGRQDRYGASVEDGWTLHIEGACGEQAVAKHLGMYWSGNLGNLKAADVGSLQVRTRSRHNYDLLLHRTDADESAWVLVTGAAPRFSLRGWCFGREGKDEKFWKDPAGGRPAFFVPQSVLRPMSELKKVAGL